MVHGVMDNVNPDVFEPSEARPTLPEDTIDRIYDEIDAREIFGKSSFTWWRFSVLLKGHPNTGNFEAIRVRCNIRHPGFILL